MIKKIAKQITMFFIHQKSISEKDMEVYQYGAEITISSLLNIILVMLVSIATNDIISGIIFLNIFIILRQFSGGYHATTYFRCNIVFLITYITVLLMSKYIIVSFWINCTFSLLGIIAMVLFAPVPNIHKLLEEDECKIHKRKSIISYIAFSIIGIIIAEICDFYSKVIFFTLMSIVILIIIEIFMQRRGLHESSKDSC